MEVYLKTVHQINDNKVIICDSRCAALIYILVKLVYTCFGRVVALLFMVYRQFFVTHKSRYYRDGTE